MQIVGNKVYTNHLSSLEVFYTTTVGYFLFKQNM